MTRERPLSRTLMTHAPWLVAPHIETNPRHPHSARSQESGSPPSSPLNEPILEPRQVGDGGGTGVGTRARLQSRLPGYGDEPTCTFIASPPRNDELIDEIKFIQLKAAEERVELFKACPTFDAYLTMVQKDVRPRHRHIVFEWILKIGDKSMLQLNTKALQYAFYYFDRYPLADQGRRQPAPACGHRVRVGRLESLQRPGAGGPCVSAVPARRWHRAR